MLPPGGEGFEDRIWCGHRALDVYCIDRLRGKDLNFISILCLQTNEQKKFREIAIKEAMKTLSSGRVVRG